MGLVLQEAGHADQSPKTLLIQATWVSSPFSTTVFTLLIQADSELAEHSVIAQTKRYFRDFFWENIVFQFKFQTSQEIRKLFKLSSNKPSYCRTGLSKTPAAIQSSSVYAVVDSQSVVGTPVSGRK